MKIESFPILSEVKMIHPTVHGDERGIFFESYNIEKYKNIEAEIDRTFIQDNVSYSSFKNTVRGMHWQLPPWAQGKLVSVLRGEVLDCAVDIRLGSPNFGRYVTARLSEFNQSQMYIPPGFAHGFMTTTDNVIFSYKCTNLYSKEHEASFKFNDTGVGIPWPELVDFCCSNKDFEAPLLEDLVLNHPEKLFKYGELDA